MIFASSDIESLARELWWWEHAEYLFAALVTVGCLGEYTADFVKHPWIIGHKEGIAKRSTLLLIGALALELICLVRTNDLSGRVIGSLSQKAAKAGERANEAITLSSNALSQANDALSKAGKAQDSLAEAEREANAAHAAASNALTLAGSARQEADSFEKDIKSATKQAADAESHLADALKQAADAQAELNRLKSPRSLTNTSAVVSALQQFKGTEYMFLSVFADEESISLLKEIDGALQRAEWKRVQPQHPFPPAINPFGRDTDVAVSSSLTTGIRVHVESPEKVSFLQALPVDKLPPNVRAAVALRNALASSLSPSQENLQVDVQNGTSGEIRIDVGKKP